MLQIDGSKSMLQGLHWNDKGFYCVADIKVIVFIWNHLGLSQGCKSF